MSDNNNPFSQIKSNRWGSPNSWDKSPAYFRQQIRQQKAEFRKEQKQVKDSWGQPSAWNYQSANLHQNQTNKNTWGNPFGWPQSLSSQKVYQNQLQRAKQHVYPQSTIQSQTAWGNQQVQGWALHSNNSYQNGQNSNISGWGAFQNYSNQIEDLKLKGDQFFEFLKQRDIDDEVICILAREGINSLQILRLCSQQALAVKGIKLSEVIKLKNL